MNTLFLGFPLFFGSLIGFGFLVKLFVNAMTENLDENNFITPLLFWTGSFFVAAFIVQCGYWFMADCTAFLDDIVSYEELDDFNFIIKLKYSFICAITFSLSFTTMMAYKIYKKNKIILYYGIFALISSVFIGTLINLVFKNAPLLLTITVDIVIFIVVIVYFEKYDSSSRKNKLLIKHINNINSRIKNSINVVKEFFTDYKTVGFKKSKYNKYRRRANKYISKNHLYKTFQAKFDDDVKVLKIISLFDYVGNQQLKIAYKTHKKILEKENTFRLLEKASKNKSVEIIIADTKEFLILLEAVVQNNCNEIVCLSDSEENKRLYNKYGVFQTEQIRGKFIFLSTIVMALLIVSIILRHTNMI